MSLNKILLNPGQLADWYGQQLVQSADSQGTAVQTAGPILGDFTKGVLILINEPTQAFLSDDDLAFLTGILSACQLNLAEVGILNLNNVPGIQARDLQQTYHPKAWWFFGPEPIQLGMTDINTGTTKNRFEGAPVFASLPLRQLAQEPGAKKVLWTQLKAHYGM